MATPRRNCARAAEQSRVPCRMGFLRGAAVQCTAHPIHKKGAAAPAHPLRSLRIIMSTNSYARQRRGPKAGSTAIPFMITILISMLVFGGLAFYFYDKLTAKSRELKPMEGNTKIISEEDINTILFVLNPDAEDRKNAVMLLRFDPVRKEIYCIGIPLEMRVQLDNRLMTVGACYDNHGMIRLKDAISDTIGQPIDRYIELNSTSFRTLINIFGNPKCTVDITETGLKKSQTPTVLDISAFELLLTSNQYPNENARCTKIGLSISQLINDCITPEETRDALEAAGGERIANNLDSYFNTVINAVNTDITVLDFNNHKHAISYIFQYAKAPARAMQVSCEKQEDDSLIPTESFLTDLKIAFNQSNEIVFGASEGTVEAQEEGQPEGETPAQDAPEQGDAPAQDEAPAETPDDAADENADADADAEAPAEE